jgi:aminodeoxyfutalosine synthase
MPASEQDLLALAASPNILQIGMVSDEARRQRHGTRTTFVRVAQIPLDAPPETTWPAAAGEVRITGTPATRAIANQCVAALASRVNGTPLSGFSLADLEQLAARDGVTLRALLEDLQAAGLELVAEAPVDKLQNARRSIEELNIAGLALARLSLHQSPAVDPLPLMKSVAELQRGVGVIRAFAPLPRRMNPAVPTTGYDDVKRVALARIVCGNIPSIQVDWSLYGPKLAQVALTVGADDVDAISPLDETTEGRRRAPLEEIRRNIRAAGLDPVERNGRFDPRPA